MDSPFAFIALVKPVRKQQKGEWRGGGGVLAAFVFSPRKTFSYSGASRSQTYPIRHLWKELLNILALFVKRPYLLLQSRVSP